MIKFDKLNDQQKQYVWDVFNANYRTVQLINKSFIPRKTDHILKLNKVDLDDHSDYSDIENFFCFQTLEIRQSQLGITQLRKNLTDYRKVLKAKDPKIVADFFEKAFQSVDLNSAPDFDIQFRKQVRAAAITRFDLDLNGYHSFSLDEDDNRARIDYTYRPSYQWCLYYDNKDEKSVDLRKQLVQDFLEEYYYKLIECKTAIRLCPKFRELWRVPGQEQLDISHPSQGTDEKGNYTLTSAIIAISNSTDRVSAIPFRRVFRQYYKERKKAHYFFDPIIDDFCINNNLYWNVSSGRQVELNPKTAYARGYWKSNGMNNSSALRHLQNQERHLTTTVLPKLESILKKAIFVKNIYDHLDNKK